MGKIKAGDLTITWTGLDPEMPGVVTIDMPLDPSPVVWLLDQELRAVLNDPDGEYLAHGGAPPVPSRSWYAVYMVVKDFCDVQGLPFSYSDGAPPAPSTAHDDLVY